MAAPKARPADFPSPLVPYDGITFAIPGITVPPGGFGSLPAVSAKTAFGMLPCGAIQTMFASIPNYDAIQNALAIAKMPWGPGVNTPSPNPGMTIIYPDNAGKKAN
jgi:hypothetical protein